ncbi:hypothetical protein HDU76_009826, partial [Blyttiomyces sp. JEL0837]
MQPPRTLYVSVMNANNHPHYQGSSSSVIERVESPVNMTMSPQSTLSISLPPIITLIPPTPVNSRPITRLPLQIPRRSSSVSGLVDSPPIVALEDSSPNEKTGVFDMSRSQPGNGVSDGGRRGSVDGAGGSSLDASGRVIITS